MCLQSYWVLLWLHTSPASRMTKAFWTLGIACGEAGRMQTSKRLGPVFWENAIIPISQLDSTFKKRLLIAIDRLPTDFLSFFYLGLFCEAQPFTPTKAQDVTCIHQEDQALMERGVYGLGGFLARSKKLLILWSQPYLGQL